ncbi:UNVERIFIED_CONTAM: hypothetical protein Sradi_0489900 [Sesamum radiatum]|uniref:Uncharacterized protein n=1 Tax=Sesamum radiatum TaxID=300843 RepID=A0AAW2WCF0_SESRA
MASTSNTVPVVVAGDARFGNETANTIVQLIGNSNMIMIFTPLKEHNWLMRIVLEGKDKLGFTDGSEVAPADGSTGYKKWRIVDSVVRT